MTVIRRLTVVVALLMLCACQAADLRYARPDGPPIDQRDVSKIPNAVPKYEPKSRLGNSPTYEVAGQNYHVLDSNKNYRAVGVASWYGTKFQDHTTSNGEAYDLYAMTAAHRSLPIPTYVRVTNSENGKQVIVRVNDRGPFHSERLIDLSYAAARKLQLVAHGTAKVLVESIDVSPDQITPTNQLYFQLAAFNKPDRAKAFAQKIADELQRNVEIVPSAEANQPLWYRVELGPLQKQDPTVQSLKTRLQQLGLKRILTVMR